MYSTGEQYRTELWMNDIKEHQLHTPICIPSMNRADAPFFQKFNKDKHLTADNVYVFIRPTEEQRALYCDKYDWVTVVELPEWVTDIGLTRQAILQWAHENGHSNIFMFDDRVTSVNILHPSLSVRTHKMSLQCMPNTNAYDGLLMWEHILSLYPFSLSGVAHKGFSYFPARIDAPYAANAGTCVVCININVDDMYKYGIQYHSSSVVGCDDGAFQYDVMKAGLPICQLSDLEYDEVPSQSIASGGTHEAGTDLKSRVLARNKLFYENYLGVPYPSKHPYVRHQTMKGIPYLCTMWKYWKQYYADHAVKLIPTHTISTLEVTMYRTEVMYSNLPGHALTVGLETPICIPSMNRPDAPIFKCLSGFDRSELYVFIRPTDEQRAMYSKYANDMVIVELPESVHDIGTTRQAIIEWAHQHRFHNIFMLDDRIKSVDFLAPRLSRNGTVALQKSPYSTFRVALLVWEQFLREHPYTMSAPSHKGFSYFAENIDKPYEANNGIVCACVNINVDDFFQYGIHYKSMDEVGGEDIAILVDVMEAGLPIHKLTDFEYDEVDSSKIDHGGCHDGYNSDIAQRVIDRNVLLWKNVFGLKYPEHSSKVYIRKANGVEYPYLKWQYWKTVYAKNAVKIVT